MKKTSLFVTGGKDEFFSPRPYPRFYIGDRHTAYEWAMVLADLHPYPSEFSTGDGAGVDGEKNTRHRLCAIDLSPKSLAIYRAIEAAHKAGEITAVNFKRDWYEPPAEPDPTLRVFDTEAILKVIRPLGSNGRIIGKLLAMHPEQQDVCMPTGMPGRPSESKHLISAESKRRIAENTCKASLREEATELQQWFRSLYPNAQRPTVKTIENNIRADLRRWTTARRTEAS